ncbi:uncharacterized protein N7479_001621 [Penicillium vulpinum]|uniref:uncharacterized protein n=1 Tax=Penicillium vulpinum TaxID=29845 RepID=UPI002547143F|nr:uncharacterized protein N7479_001621 [Penicillium vulpinum]KAJ5971703.1 hypothetical protein N7479_001621 [Penicillium vulpinum]
MCYYNEKLFGDYIALLVDRIFANCCKPAVTAYLNTSYIQSVPPTAPILLRAWPVRVEISAKVPQDWTEATKTVALFIKPKDQSSECRRYMETDSHRGPLIRQSGFGIRSPASACQSPKDGVICLAQLPGRKMEVDSHQSPLTRQSGFGIQPMCIDS